MIHTAMFGADSRQRARRPRVKTMSAVWTGEEMVIWGGDGGGYLNTGGRYRPATGGWSPLLMPDVPAGHAGHTASWTGNALLVWGGKDQSGELGTGGRYQMYLNLYQKP